MTRQKMFLKMVMSSLVRRSSRMLVALFAIAIGITILFGLLTIYRDIPRQMGKEFRNYGANLVILPKNTASGINQQEYLTLKSIIPQDRTVGIAPYRYQNIKINEQPFIIAATDLEQAQKNSPYWLVDGSWPQKEREVLVGNAIAQNIGLKLGDNFEIALTEGDSKAQEDRKIMRRVYVVSGIVKTGGAEESFVFMSFDDFSRIISDNWKADVIECSIEGDEAYLQSITKSIEEQNANLAPRLARRLTQSQDLVLNKLKTLVWIVTVIVLLLTIISVSTTMMAVVAQRRKEIGLKKALGAPNSSIVLEFFGEALFLGVLGGFVGIVFGFIFARNVSVSVFARTVAFHYGLIPLSIVIAIVITGFACLVPVRKAVYIEPAIVLRGE